MRTRSQTCHGLTVELEKAYELIWILEARNALLLQQANAWQIEASMSKQKAICMEKSAICQLQQQSIATDRLERAEEYIRRLEERFGKLPDEEDCRHDIVDLCDEDE